MIRDANAELESSEPWKLPPGEAVDAILGDALEVLRIVAVLVAPAMPKAAKEIWRRLGMPGEVDEPGIVERGALVLGRVSGRDRRRKGSAALPAPPDGRVVSDAVADDCWTDTHCHVQASYLKEPLGEDQVFLRASVASVGRIVCVGTDVVASLEAIDLARSRSKAGATPSTWATVGLHPHEASRGLGPVRQLLENQASVDRRPGSVVAVGECGLDYFYEHSPRDAQRAVFAEQIALAKRFDLALVVHTRDAWDDTVDILTAEGVPERTIIHCFTGGVPEAQRMLDLGAYLSFSGIVTFKNADEVREAARLCPAERLLVETDAPFLTPVPHRGRPNEPAYVAIVGAAVADLRGIDGRELAASSSANAARVFKLEP